MKDRYSLKYYLSLHPTEAEIVSTFWQLDKQMKYLHERGYYVPDINSDTILKENNIFVFESIKKNDNRDENISSNILELATLAIDSFVSAGVDSLQDVRISDYYQRVVIDGVRNEYLSTSLESAESMNQESKKDSKTYTKSTEAGKSFGRSDDAGFIRIVFYPIMISLILTFLYVVISMT